MVTREPIIVLVRPQLAENIGAVARAMLNFGLTKLRLVSPLVDPLSPQAIATSAGAQSVLKSANLYEHLSQAIADLTDVYGTCAQERDMIKCFMPAREGVTKAHQEILDPQRSAGIVFGPERTGLHNDEMALMKAIWQIPVNPNFSSLNLAQALAIIAYEWHNPLNIYQTTIGSVIRCGETHPARQEQLQYFFDTLETQLDQQNFWRVPSKKPTMWRNIQNIFARTELTEQEIRTLLGLLKSLNNENKAKKIERKSAL